MSTRLKGLAVLVSAAVLGLITSLHCVGMCGPIACGLTMFAKTEGEKLSAATLYHGARLFSYGLIGAVCGALGRQPLKWFFDSPAVVLPWLMVAVLLLVAFDLDKKIPKPTFLVRFTAKASLKARKLPVCAGAGAMGLLTPLMPCGPLYAAFGTALATGAASKGAEFAVAFGLGTVPLLWLAQQQFYRLRAKLNPRMMSYLRRGLALATAIVLAWRFHGTLEPLYERVRGKTAVEKPAESAPVKEALPSCCHH